MRAVGPPRSGTEAERSVDERPPDPAVPWFEAFADRFRRASDAVGVEERTVPIGGIGVRLRFAGDALVPGHWPAFEPLATRVDGGGVEIWIWDSQSTGVGAPQLDWRLEREDAGGYIARYAGPDILALQEWGRPGFSLVRPAAGVAVHHVPGPTDVSVLERAAPLRFALHGLLAPLGRHLIHAGAVGVAGSGILLAGASGAGKSTLSLACLAEGMQWAGDDYVALELGQEPVAHALHATAKVMPSVAAELGLGDLPITPAEPPEEKLVLSVPGPDAGLVRRLSVRAILIPRIAGADRPMLADAGAGAAFAALAPTTMVQPSSRSESTMRSIAELVRAVPSYLLELSRDHRRNARLVRALLDG
jgi:hypothetical protein